MQRASSWQGVDFVQHYVSLPFGFLPLHPRRRYQLRCSCLSSFNARDNLCTRSCGMCPKLFLADNEISVLLEFFLLDKQNSE